MSVLGKILVFLNILGVGGFLYLATLTYGKRKAWEYANFRADLLYNPETGGGLPLDEEDRDKAGVPLILKFGADESQWKEDKTLKEIFPSNPPKMPTQVAEVERVHELLKNQLDAVKDDPRKRNLLLARILMPLAGRKDHPEIYVDREFYLSMKTNLEDDAAFEAFKKSLADAFPIAVTALWVKGDPTFDATKLSFEKAFQEALQSLPGEDKWKLAEKFLSKLPRSGATFQQAVVAAKQAADDVEAKLKAVEDAKATLEDAKRAYFVATIEAKGEPVAAARIVKEKKVANLKVDLEDAERDYNKAVDAAKLLPKPRDAAAVAFLRTIRKDDAKTKVPEFVEEVVKETLDEVNNDLTARFDKVYAEARLARPKSPVDPSGPPPMRDHRREAIARVLLGAIEVLENNDAKTLEGEGGKSKVESMVDLPSYKRFIAVVGLESAVNAINQQFSALADVAGDLNARIAEEKETFRFRHEGTIGALEARANEIEVLALRLEEIKAQATEQAKRASDEKDRVDLYVKDLKVSRDETALRLAELQKLTNGLNTVRIAIRNAIRNNERNLDKIANLELEVQYWETKLAEKEKAEKDKKKKKLAP